MNINMLQLVGFARQAHEQAHLNREAVIEHLDAESDAHRAVIADVELAVRLAESVYMGTLELAGITDSDVAVANGSPVFFDTAIRCLIKAKPRTNGQAKPATVDDRIGLMVTVTDPAHPCFGQKGRITEIAPDGSIASLYINSFTLARVRRFQVRVESEAVHQGADVAAPPCRCHDIGAEFCNSPIHNSKAVDLLADELVNAARREVADVGRTVAPLNFNTMYLSREKVAAESIS